MDLLDLCEGINECRTLLKNCPKQRIINWKPAAGVTLCMFRTSWPRCGLAPTTVLAMGVTAPNPHAPRATANRPHPLQAGARSTRRGLRVGVVDSLEWGFVWMRSQLDPMPPISFHIQRAQRLVWPPLTSLSLHFGGKLIWACRAVHSRKVIKRPDPMIKNIPIKVVPLGSSAQITKSIATAKTR